MASSAPIVGYQQHPNNMRRTAPAAASRIPVPQAQRRDETRHVSAPHQRSRLLAMQDAYQKRLMKEKEERMLSIYNKQQEQSLQRVQKHDSEDGTNNGQGIVRNFFKERKEMEQSRGSAHIISRDAHFQKKLLEKKRTSTLSSDYESQDSRNHKAAVRSDVQEQRRHEERKEYEMQTYKKQWQESQAQSSPKHAKGIVRSKPLAPIKRESVKAKAQMESPSTYNHYETSGNLSYDDDDDDENDVTMMPPSRPQKVSHRTSKKTYNVHDSPELQKPPTQTRTQPGKPLNPKKVAPPIARGKQNQIKVKKEKASDFQKWQEEQDLQRHERLKKYEEKETTQRDHYTVDYDRELEKDAKSAKARRKKEYDDMMTKEQELEELIAKHKEDLAKMSTSSKDDEEDDDLPPQKARVKPIVKKAKKPPKPAYQFDDEPSPFAYHQEDDYESRAGEFKSRQRQAPAKPKPKRTVQPKEPDPIPPYQTPSPVSYDTSLYDQANEDDEISDVNLATCSICGRRFAAERLAKHTSVCKKSSKKKRKVFDSTKHRTAGTELAQYVQRGQHLQNEPPPTKPSNWKRKHEDFVRSIRDARQTQAYVAKGGNLADLPPPPPAENPDYKQCPHCKRRFNPATAERHIPKCKDIKSRPKPPRKK